MFKATLTAILLASGALAFCQPRQEDVSRLSKRDTVLYLWLSPEDDTKNVYGIYTHPAEKKTIFRYLLISMPALYDGYILRLISICDPPSKTAEIKQLANKPIVTPKQLTAFIQANYAALPQGFNGASYFDNLTSIYILERTPCKGVVTVTKVKLNIQK